MWAYHLHYSFSHGHFTETTTVGIGWYIILFGVVGTVMAFQTMTATRSYRRRKRER